MTVLDFLRAAGRLVGALHPGQTGNQDENDVALEAFNALLDRWNAQRLAIFHVRQDTYTLTASQQDYAIGPGAADFSTTRPTRIERANLIWTDDDHRPLVLAEVADWAALRLPDLDATIPDALYYDRNFPVAKLRLYPVPDSAYTLELFTWSKLGRFAALNEIAEFPEAYEEAIKYNLALRLAMEFRTAIPAFVAQNARESLADLKRMNKVTPRLQFEYADEGRYGFDYRLGE